jgi:polyketide cyclase/dehydrase/lipid transport protein
MPHPYRELPTNQQQGRSIMSIRSLRGLLAIGVLAVPFFAGTASAAEYATVKLNISVDAPIDVVWKKVGGYCDIVKWLPQIKTCTYTSGNGELGTVRRLADRIDELLVAQGKYYYVYAQPSPPGRDILYHGTLEAVADGKKKTTILYNLVWDQSPLADDAAKKKDLDGRTTAFTNALAAMKKLAEEK